MTNLLTLAFEKAQKLPPEIQEKLAQQLIEDIENELKWQEILDKPPSAKLEELAAIALKNSSEGKTKKIGFDQL